MMEGLELSRADMKQLMAEIDTDGDGYISISEFNDRMHKARRLRSVEDGLPAEAPHVLSRLL